MKNEIERKFFIKKMPNLENLKGVLYERYFLFINSDTEIRIQKKGEKYEFERKVVKNKLKAEKQKFEIKKEEFDELKKFSTKSIIRESFKIQNNPDISLKIYHGKFEGLKRVEVEFLEENEAKSFIPFDWFGKEITDLSLGKDSKLVLLTSEEFQKIIEH